MAQFRSSTFSKNSNQADSDDSNGSDSFDLGNAGVIEQSAASPSAQSDDFFQILDSSAEEYQPDLESSDESEFFFFFCSHSPDEP